MTKAEELIANIKAAPSYRRAEMLDQVERDYGRGFAKAVREAIEASALLDKNEASVRRRRR